jgi:predicted site-specific integrase-resolvase
MPRGDATRKRCAIYTRKSSEEGLEQEFNSLAAQREACEAFIRSQQHEGWALGRTRYDDGGFSGGNMERPALQGLLAEIRARRIDIVVVYKVDRLTRSLADFARLVEIFDAEAVSFVSVTQQFNTTSSMGRLTLNVLLSFAQFEREVTGERNPRQDRCLNAMVLRSPARKKMREVASCLCQPKSAEPTQKDATKWRNRSETTTLDSVRRCARSPRNGVNSPPMRIPAPTRLLKDIRKQPARCRANQ